MILKGTSNKDPLDIYMKNQQLFRVRQGERIIWERTPDVFSGTVKYEKENSGFPSPNLPINAYVRLYDKEMNFLEESYNNSTGYFEFTNRYVLHNTRWVEVEIDFRFGGLSSGDSTAINNRVNYEAPTYWNPIDFVDHVADIDGDGVITSSTDVFSDSQQVFRRHVGITTEYTNIYGENNNWALYTPDWKFGVPRPFARFTENSQIVPYKKQKTLEVWARCYGDVRGTYNPIYEES